MTTVVVDARDTDALAADPGDVAAGPATSFEHAEMAMSESRNNGILDIKSPVLRKAAPQNARRSTLYLRIFPRKGQPWLRIALNSSAPVGLRVYVCAEPAA